jgi:GalNAc5-diNAcBac-PP-undecaprenol beta-1,3-glucosyltransferase
LLPRAIASVLNGGYANFELFIIDDASSDDTPAVAAQFTDERIRYVRLDRNGGVLRARNRGFDLAKGSFIALLDDDDELLPGVLGRVVAELTAASREGVEILWFDCVDAEVDQASGQMNHPTRTIRFDDLVCDRIEGDFWVVFSDRAMAGNRFREDLRAHESLLWLRIHKKFAARHVPLLTCKKYRQHGGERLSHVDVRLKQLPETTRALLAYITEFGEDIRRACPRNYGFRLAFLGLHELMAGEREAGRRHVAESLRYRFSFKYLVVLLLSWVWRPEHFVALYRRSEG